MKFALPLFIFATILATGRVESCPNYVASGTNQPIDLSGAWKFKPGHVPGAENETFDDSTWTAAKLPARYGALGLDKGPSWYRCKLYLNGGRLPFSQVAIDLGKTREADEVYFNGVLIGQTGNMFKPSVDLESTRIYPIPSKLWKEENVVAIRMFGTTPDAGIDSVELVDHGKRLNRKFLPETVAAVFSIYYLLTSIYFLSFALFTSNRKPNAFLGLFSVCLGLYSLIRAGYRYSFFTDFTMSYSFELILLFLMPVFFLNYMVSWIGIDRPIWLKVLEILYAGLIAFTAAIPFIPGNVSTYFSIVINVNLAGIVCFLVPGIMLYFKYFKTHHRKLKYIGIGFLILIPTVVNDMLSTLEIIHTPRIMVFGFSLFLGFLALQLSEGIFELGEDLIEQQAELKKLDRRKASTIYEVSNEFQALFQSILSMINPGQKSKRSKPSKKAKTHKLTEKEKYRLNGALTNLENLVKDSHILASLEDQNREFKQVRFSIRESIESAAERAVLTTLQKPERLILRLPDQTEVLRGDEELFQMAVFHPIENALQYSEGDVEVVVEITEKGALIKIRDEGPGIQPGLQNLVFDKFVRGYEHQHISGSGIGLTIVKWIVDSVGGSVELSSSPGFFTSIEIFFPDMGMVDAES